MDESFESAIFMSSASMIANQLYLEQIFPIILIYLYLYVHCFEIVIYLLKLLLVELVCRIGIRKCW